VTEMKLWDASIGDKVRLMNPTFGYEDSGCVAVLVQSKHWGGFVLDGKSTPAVCVAGIGGDYGARLSGWRDVEPYEEN